MSQTQFQFDLINNCHTKIYKHDQTSDEELFRRVLEAHLVIAASLLWMPHAPSWFPVDVLLHSITKYIRKQERMSLGSKPTEWFLLLLSSRLKSCSLFGVSCCQRLWALCGPAVWPLTPTSGWNGTHWAPRPRRLQSCSTEQRTWYWPNVTVYTMIIKGIS